MAEPSANPPPNLPYCHGCNKKLPNIRHHCRQCADFDYCDECVVDAAKTHPSHDLIAVDLDKHALPEDVQLEWRAKRNKSTESDSSLRLTGQSKDLPAQLCSSCVHFGRAIANIPMLVAERPRLKRNGNLTFKWAIKISSLVAATQRGCAFCSLLLRQFFGASDTWTRGIIVPVRPWYMEPGQNTEREILVAHVMHNLDGLADDLFVCEVRPLCTKPGYALPNFNSLKISLTECSLDQDAQAKVLRGATQSYIMFDAFAAADTPLAAFMQQRPPNASPGSESALSTVHGWLMDCKKNHPACRPQRDSEAHQRPRRLIDVSSSMLKLHQPTEQEDIEYATLSYCWGGSQDSKLTKQNFTSRLDGFSADDLPATIQHGIKVTRGAGLKYLWVDSLCIVQDDDKDILSQLDIMGNIYRNSQLTISANVAKTAEEGFLTDFSDPDTGLYKELIPVGCVLPSREAKTYAEGLAMASDSFGTLWLLKEFPRLPNREGFTTLRGWCLQEKFLSPKVLEYGRWPTWRCNSATLSDGGWYYETDFTSPSLRRFGQDMLKPDSALADPSMDPHGVRQLFKTWRDLVADFTVRKFAVDKDKLPAIAGIAAEMQRQTKAEYCAGLWRNNLLSDMMWFANTKEWLSRYDQPLGPTWSWVSVNCPVTYNVTDDSVAMARVLDCQVRQETVASPPSGHITIRGPVREVAREDVLNLLKHQGMPPAPPKSNEAFDWDMMLLQHMMLRGDQKHLMEDVEANLPERVFAVLTFTRDWHVRFEEKVEKTCYSGLLLRRREGEGCGEDEYERIGSFMNDDREWMEPGDVWKTETVKIF